MWFILSCMKRETEIKIEANVKRSEGIFYFVKINTSWVGSNEEKSKVDLAKCRGSWKILRKL